MRSIVFFVLVVGCSKGGDATPVASPHVTASATRPACDGSNALIYETKTARPGWNVVGHLELAVANGDVTKLDVKDSAGTVVESTPLHAKMMDKDTVLPALFKGICRANGDVGVMDDRARAETAKVMKDGSGVVAFDVVTAAKEDESADADRFCQAPADFKPSDDAEHRGVIDYAHAHDRLTWLSSRKWRGWMDATDHKLDVSHEQRHAAAVARADELETMTKRQGACWYATILRAL